MTATLKLLSSMATREVLNELATRYERDTNQKIATEAAGGVDVAMASGPRMSRIPELK